MAGAVVVGECSWIGIGASVKQGIKIGAKVVVGAGSAVVSEIEGHQVVVGIPAKVKS